MRSRLHIAERIFCRTMRRLLEGVGVLCMNYKMDLKTGRSELIIFYANIAKFTGYPIDLSNYHHWYNHLLVKFEYQYEL